MRTRKGFSLMEIMIVVAIMAVLAVVTLGSYIKTAVLLTDTKDLLVSKIKYEQTVAQATPPGGYEVIPKPYIKISGGNIAITAKEAVDSTSLHEQKIQVPNGQTVTMTGADGETIYFSKTGSPQKADGTGITPEITISATGNTPIKITINSFGSIAITE